MKRYIKQPKINIFDLVITRDPIILEQDLIGWVIEKKIDSINGEEKYIVEWCDGVRTEHTARTVDILRDNLIRVLGAAKQP
jgi:hypothetical protein